MPQEIQKLNHQDWIAFNVQLNGAITDAITVILWCKTDGESWGNVFLSETNTILVQAKQEIRND